jgi:hypothetical protein
LHARELQPSPVATAQIGLAHQALGEWVEAEAELQDGLRERSDPWIAKNRTTLEGALAAVRTHLGGVEVVGLPAGAEIFIDGRRVGVAPLASPVRATIGTVALEVRCAGYLPVVRNVSIAADELSRETVTLTREAISTQPSIPVAEKAADEPRPTVSESHTTAAWVLGGTATALLATGVVAVIVRSSKVSSLEAHLKDTTCSQSADNFGGSAADECVKLATARDTWTWVAVGTLVGAGAAATTAVVLAVRSSGDHGPRVSVDVRPGLALASASWNF